MQLTRRQTMKRASEFALVRAEGTSQAGRFLILSLAPLPQGKEQASRFGIITTKRIGHAVVRNQMRRRVREILRSHAAPLERGYYVVIIVRNRAPMSDYGGLEKDFRKLLEKQLHKLSVC